MELGIHGPHNNMSAMYPLAPNIPRITDDKQQNQDNTQASIDAICMKGNTSQKLSAIAYSSVL